MRSSAKFILLHHIANKAGGRLPHRGWLVAFLLLFFFTLTFTIFIAKYAALAAGKPDSIAARASSDIPEYIYDALVHYASATSTSSSRMPANDVKYIAGVLRRCAAPCNVLIFGLNHETLLWNSLNHDGRTVFVDESAYKISKFEQRFPSIEAYDVQFPARASEFRDLIKYFRAESRNECRPAQNLLFSDCKLAINDLPNDVYDVSWDVIIVDGPRGYSGNSPGRMTAIFTAGVLARSKRGGASETHVFVHEIDRELEKICSEEFLCGENMVNKNNSLGHFVIGKNGAGANNLGFCSSVPSKSI